MKRARSTLRQKAQPVPTQKLPGGPETITVPVLPPRNPYQALARARKGGAHDEDARKRRRLEKREWRRKLIDE